MSITATHAFRTTLASKNTDANVIYITEDKGLNKIELTLTFNKSDNPAFSFYMAIAENCTKDIKIASDEMNKWKISLGSIQEPGGPFTELHFAPKEGVSYKEGDTLKFTLSNFSVKALTDANEIFMEYFIKIQNSKDYILQPSKLCMVMPPAANLPYISNILNMEATTPEKKSNASLCPTPRNAAPKISRES